MTTDTAKCTDSEIRRYVLSKGHIVRNSKCRITRDGKVMAYGCKRGSRELEWFLFGIREDVCQSIALARLDGAWK